MTRFNITTFPLFNKRVLLRVDWNVPFQEGKVKDDYKIKATLPTIHYLLKKNCKIIILTHFGRPHGQIDKKWSVLPLVKEINRLLPGIKVEFLENPYSEIKEDTQIAIVENIRFYKGEENNNKLFAKQLAQRASVFVNDAFSVSHREHASINAITQFLPSIGGFLLEKEIKELYSFKQSQKPLVWIIGGAKFDKLKDIKKIAKLADKIIIGGALAFSFLRAKGYSVGMSKIDKASITLAQEVLKSKKLREKIILPVDVICAEKLSSTAKARNAYIDSIPLHGIGLDIGTQSINLFKKELDQAKTIIWNGPLGYTEWKKFSIGTKEVMKELKTINALKIAGGGETLRAINECEATKWFTHVSLGGGATLQYLIGNELPGISALEKNYKKFRKQIK